MFNGLYCRFCNQIMCRYPLAHAAYMTGLTQQDQITKIIIDDPLRPNIIEGECERVDDRKLLEGK